MDCSLKLITGKQPCNFSMEFESVCGNGDIEILNGKEKIKGIGQLMKHYSNNSYEFTEDMLKNLTISKLVVNEISGKASPRFNKLSKSD